MYLGKYLMHFYRFCSSNSLHFSLYTGAKSCVRRAT